jgi:hypothetical protein
MTHKKDCPQRTSEFVGMTYVPCTCPDDRTQEKAFWEDGFEKISRSSGSWCSCYEGDIHNLFDDTQEEVKSFIRKAIETAIKEERERNAALRAKELGEIVGWTKKVMEILRRDGVCACKSQCQFHAGLEVKIIRALDELIEKPQ